MIDPIALAILHSLSAWLAADLATGAVHWWEDRYGDPAWPVIGIGIGSSLPRRRDR